MVLSQVIQFLVRTLSASVGIVIVIGSSFPPFLIAVVPLGWMYSRFMTLVPRLVWTLRPKTVS